MNFFLSTFKMLNDDNNEDKENTDEVERPVSTESLSEESPSKTQVFLRIRPASSIQNKNINDIYAIENSSTLLVKQCASNDTSRRSKTNENVVRKKFSFSKIFNQEIDQSQFFNEAIRPTIIDFLNNQSSTVLSYGTCDAGKTYTLFGTALEPGIIPRSIEFIYSSLNCTLTSWYKPERVSSVINIDECDRSLEIETMEKILNCRLIDKSVCEDAYRTLEETQLNKNRDMCKDSMYSVWISFVEIYNEAIFDLLEVDEEGKNLQLKLVTDKHGAPYIQGMRSVCATTGLEAYEILNAGQTRLRTVSSSNYKSSRSHSIFTIKLLKYEKDCAPSQVEVSSISFCDLAGTGKIQKSVSKDKQFKESQSINKSLLALGRCLKVIAEGNSRQCNGPFRDSKLTRLFQRSLCGKENIILLINVNPTPELFQETQNVLSFASTAMKLASEFSKEDKRLVDYYTPISSPKPFDNRLSASAKVLREQDIDAILQKNKQLADKVKELTATMSTREWEIRKELMDSYAKQLNDFEENWEKKILATEKEKEILLEMSVDRIESYKRKLDECTNRKRKRDDRGDYGERLDVEIPETENTRFSSKILSFRKSLESMKTENKQLNIQKNRHSFEMLLLKKNLKKLTDFINSSQEKIDNNIMDIRQFSMEKNDTNISLDDCIVTYLSAIHEFIEQSFKKENCSENSKFINVKSTKEVQCTFRCSAIDDFCKEVQELLNPHSVQLPKIDDSLDSLQDFSDSDAINDDTTNLLRGIKELIIKHVSKVLKLKLENKDKSEQLKLLEDKIKQLENKIKQQEREIFQIKEQYEESESARLSLVKEVEDLKITSKSKEFFKPVDLVLVEPENCFDNESHCQIIVSNQQMTSRNSFNDSQLSLFEVDMQKVEYCQLRSSSESSKNDSGLASSVECVTDRATNEKYSQTSIFPEEDPNYLFQDRLMQLKLDYKQMNTQHLQESLRVTELSQELEHVREELSKLKENTSIKERAITEYQSKLNTTKTDIERLNSEKRQLESKCNELSKTLQEANKEYEKKLSESQVKLKIHEKVEDETKKRLEDYWKKSVSLGSELSIAYSELEKNSVWCYEEHMVKINKLEKELNERKSNENVLEEQLTEYKKDFAEMNELSDRVTEFESTLVEVEKERSELRRLLSERSESQLEIEVQLHDLNKKIEDRDDQVLTLKTELAALIKTNLSNSRRAKELSKEVPKLMEKMCAMKEDIVHSEEARKDLERSSSKEIGNLRARLTIFEENAELLSMICDTNESKQGELDKLKLKLLEKEKELELFKKNRNATIQRYECLVRQLQNTLKINHHSSKFKKSSPHRPKYFYSDLKESWSCDVHNSESPFNDWKSYDDDHSYLLSCPSIHTMSHLTSAEISKSNTRKEEPSRLVTNISDKSLETGKGIYLKSHQMPCKDLGLFNDFEPLIEMDLSDDNFHVNRIDAQNKFHLQ